MKIRLGMAIASIAPLLMMGAGAAPSSAAAAHPDALVPAAVSHLVTVSGSMELNDDETWPEDDERGRYEISGSRRLTHSSPEGAIVIIRCVGGEVRGELHVTLRLKTNNQVTVTPTLDLYEGTSCSTRNRENSRAGSPENLRLGGWVRWSDLGVRSFGDWASASFTVTHTR